MRWILHGIPQTKAPIARCLLITLSPTIHSVYAKPSNTFWSSATTITDTCVRYTSISTQPHLSIFIRLHEERMSQYQQTTLPVLLSLVSGSTGLLRGPHLILRPKRSSQMQVCGQKAEKIKSLRNIYIISLFRPPSFSHVRDIKGCATRVPRAVEWHLSLFIVSHVS